VFPLVKLSDNFLPKRIQWNIRKVMSPIWQRKVGFQVKQEYLDEGKNRKFAVWASSIIAAIIPKKTVLRILYRNEMRYEKKKVKWYCNIYSKYSLEKESIKAEWVKELIRVPFEDMELPIVKNYDAYLTHLYGDYMTPPAKEYQRPVHL
jgi:lipopolysaccharide cholinephosphotransferase